MEEKLEQLNETLSEIHAFLLAQLGGDNEACTKPWTGRQSSEPFPKLGKDASVKQTLCYLSCASREMLKIAASIEKR